MVPAVASGQPAGANDGFEVSIVADNSSAGRGICQAPLSATKFFSWQRIAHLLVEDHLSPEEITAYLLEESRDYILTLSTSEARRWTRAARRWIQLTCRNIKAANLTEDTNLCEYLDSLVARVNAYPLASNRGTLKRGTLAHLLALRGGADLAHHVGDRQLSLLGKIDRKTTYRRNRDIVKLGFIKKIQPNHALTATVWALDIEGLEKFPFRTPPYKYHVEYEVEKFIPATHDEFRPGGLANSGGEVLRTLYCADVPLNVKELQERTGLCKSSVYDAIKELRDKKLIAKTKTRYAIVAGFRLKDLKAIGRTLPTFKRTDGLRQRYAEERKNFRKLARDPNTGRIIKTKRLTDAQRSAARRALIEKAKNDEASARREA